YPQRYKAEDGVFDLEYTYSKEGLLAVKATLQNTGAVVLDEEVKVFGDGNVLPEVRRELDRLRALTPAARPATAPTHPQQVRPQSQGAGAPKPSRPGSPPLPVGAVTDSAPLVIDGSNLAWNGRPPRAAGGKPSFAALQAAVRSLRFKHPERDIHVVVDATLRHDVSAGERPLVEAAIADGTVVQPPAGTEGRGDALVISIGEEVDGIIVSNDNFAPFQKASPWLRASGRVMGATQSQGVWVFNRRVPNPATPAQRR
ncbi:Hsp70 family protein, partial [Streptomyces sp. NPDC057540]